MLALTKTFAKKAAIVAMSALPREQRELLKARSELRFWRSVIEPIDGDAARLRHERAHYEHFFTSFFGLTRKDYAGKRVLDIGCGPMGSLEWCDQAAERIGLDPLANQYLSLGADHHAMGYVSAPSEAIPFPANHFDVVASFNSLDHVCDVARTIAEMKRVLRPGGTILLITEIGHAPTPTEPHRLDETVLRMFENEFDLVTSDIYGVRSDHQIYRSLTEKVSYLTSETGILCARLRKRPVF